ncbi:hypothetical protein AVM11_16430 [Sphingomonas melonis TY]|jgi:hypothetical protein|uniref:Uncharacterized protein n=2 Tax=Sphingomonas melonis TaxID=152682 RepID=A0A175Y559_9SPHN|nr:hypothetical protein [Sphingomonas melonis]KZB95783.1 hypothetical protein AVM11_16430 [Sphingomonas melonis TY]
MAHDHDTVTAITGRGPGGAVGAAPGAPAADRFGLNALGIAYDLMIAGALDGVTSVRVLAARRTTGAATLDLVLDHPCGPPLLVPIASADADARGRFETRLIAAAALRRDGMAAIARIRAHACEILHDLGGEGLLEDIGIVAPSGPRRAVPVAALLLKARGADALPQTIRLDAPHPHGLRDDLRRIVDRDRRGAEAAADRAARGVAWEADAIALAAMRQAGLAPSVVVEALRRRPRVDVRISGTQGAALGWRDFTLSADLILRADRRFEGGILIIEDFELSLAMLASLGGRPLRTLLTIHPLLDDVTVDHAWLDADGRAIFVLAPERISFPMPAGALDQEGRP